MTVISDFLYYIPGTCITCLQEMIKQCWVCSSVVKEDIKVKYIQSFVCFFFPPEYSNL